MNAERLLALYDRVADAPDAVDRLRRFVLDLAVRGRLVDQDPADEPASEFLKRKESEKTRLQKAGKLKKRKLTEAAPPNDLGFELRSGWAVARFSDVLIELQTGPFGSSLHQNDYEAGGTPVINPASIQDGKIVPIEKMAVGENTLERLSPFKTPSRRYCNGPSWRNGALRGSNGARRRLALRNRKFDYQAAHRSLPQVLSHAYQFASCSGISCTIFCRRNYAESEPVDSVKE